MARRAIAVCIVLAAQLAGQAAPLPGGISPTRADEAEDIKVGRELAERRCGRCHAIGADDTSRLPIAPAFRDLSSKYPVDSLQEALAEGIVTGHAQMPQFEFEPDEVTALVAYIQSVQK